MTSRSACILGAVLMCGMAAIGYSVSAQDTSKISMVVSIKVCEEVAGSSGPKILAEPTVATVPGRRFSFQSGGEARPRTADGDPDIGTRVTGKLEHTDGGLLELALKIRMGAAVPQEDDPETQLVRTETLDIRTVLRPSETKRLRSSASQWCEVRVEVVE